MKNKLALLAIIMPMLVLAQSDPCRLSSNTVTQGSASLKKVTVLERLISPEPYGWRNCQVRVSAEVNDALFEGQGKFSWADGRPPEEACTVAQARAVESIQTQVGNLRVQSTQQLACAENGISGSPIGTPKISTIYAVGYEGEKHEFRIYSHRKFSHRNHPGSTCHEFLKPVYYHQIGGVICQNENAKWTVVDVR
jgi:hypothetical protein